MEFKELHIKGNPEYIDKVVEFVRPFIEPDKIWYASLCPENCEGEEDI